MLLLKTEPFSIDIDFCLKINISFEKNQAWRVWAADHFMGWKNKRAAQVDADLAAHVATELKNEAAIAKESNLVRSKSNAARAHQRRVGMAVRTSKRTPWVSGFGHLPCRLLSVLRWPCLMIVLGPIQMWRLEFQAVIAGVNSDSFMRQQCPWRYWQFVF